MGQPAARITDMHTCPMSSGFVPHVGGPIITGMWTVFTGNLPQARITDRAICIGPLDQIVTGAFTVLVGGQPAARIGDSTMHGGVIITGLPTVLIGDGGSGGGGAGAAAGAGAPGFGGAASGAHVCDHGAAHAGAGGDAGGAPAAGGTPGVSGPPAVGGAPAAGAPGVGGSPDAGGATSSASAAGTGADPGVRAGAGSGGAPGTDAGAGAAIGAAAGAKTRSGPNATSAAGAAGAFEASAKLGLAKSLVGAAGSGSAEDAKLVAQALATLPANVLEQMKANGTRVTACRGSITDHRPDLKGITPPGWPPGSSWENVAKAELSDTNEVAIAVVGHGTAAGPHVPEMGGGRAGSDTLAMTGGGQENATAGEMFGLTKAGGANEHGGVGTATMWDDRTIVLALSAGAPGLIGAGRLIYPLGHPNYQALLNHVGGLHPGEVELVPPWHDGA